MGAGKKLKRLVRKVLARRSSNPVVDNPDHPLIRRESLERAQIVAQDTRELYQSLAMRVVVLEKAFADANARLSRYDAMKMPESLEAYSQMRAEYDLVVKQRDQLLDERDRLLKSSEGGDRSVSLRPESR